MALGSKGMKLLSLILISSLAGSSQAETIGQSSADSAKSQVPAKVSSDGCATKNVEIQFIGEVSVTEKTKTRDKQKGQLCRFKITFNEGDWRPAEQQFPPYCPSIKRTEAQKHIFEKWDNKNGCPRVGDPVSGVLVQTGAKLELDGNWTQKEPDQI